jgi:hypothetical protein
MRIRVHAQGDVNAFPEKSEKEEADSKGIRCSLPYPPLAITPIMCLPFVEKFEKGMGKFNRGLERGATARLEV